MASGTRTRAGSSGSTSTVAASLTVTAMAVVLDLATAGVIGIGDASHGNLVDYHSQYGFLLFLADEAMMRGEVGQFGGLVDWRSAKIHRVVRSSYAAELYGITNLADALDFFRAVLCDIRRPAFDLARWEEEIASIPGVLVTDARDCLRRALWLECPKARYGAPSAVECRPEAVFGP